MLDTPAGTVRARATIGDGGRVDAVSFVNVPSFVLRAGLPIEVASRVVPVDVAFGGAFYAIVDSESAGVPLRTAELGALRELGGAIKERVDKALDVAHPTDSRLRASTARSSRDRRTMKPRTCATSPSLPMRRSTGPRAAPARPP